MRNFRLKVSYDGSDFFGWQTQPGFRTVQECLEKAISSLCNGQKIRANASGRTDTGVHAVGQVVNCFLDTRVPVEGLAKAINSRLDDDVRVLQAEEVPQAFDANRDAIRKLYRYVINNGPHPDLFMRRYSYHVRYPLDARIMARASKVLLGTHDFHSFETEWPNRLSSVRTILHLAVNSMGPWIWIDVEADGFLYNMVRTIVGTLINVGRGYWPEEDVARILKAEDRTQAGPTAPASGLFLMRVTYER